MLASYMDAPVAHFPFRKGRAEKVRPFVREAASGGDREPDTFFRPFVKRRTRLTTLYAHLFSRHCGCLPIGHRSGPDIPSRAL